MTNLRHFLAGGLAVLTIDAIVHYRLVWLAMLIGGSIAAALIVGWVLNGRDRYEEIRQQRVDDLYVARMRARDRGEQPARQDSVTATPPRCRGAHGASEQSGTCSPSTTEPTCA